MRLRTVRGCTTIHIGKTRTMRGGWGSWITFHTENVFTAKIFGFPHFTRKNTIYCCMNCYGFFAVC